MSSRERIFLETVAQLTGDEVRTFMVDYRDNYGNYYSHEVNIALSSKRIADKFIVANLIQQHKDIGYTVFGICEMLNGITLAELEKLTPKKARKSVRMLYYDPANAPPTPMKKGT